MSKMRPQTRECPFCARVARGEYSWSNAAAVGFEPLDPVAPGHLLAIPKAHVEDAVKAPIEAGQAMQFAAELAYCLQLAPCNFITSVGPEATQSVYHLHIHIVPRRAGDGLLLPWGGQHAKYAKPKA